ncbi:MAG: Kelch repeat-containing protein [Planctomycetota bacterium]
MMMKPMTLLIGLAVLATLISFGGCKADNDSDDVDGLEYNPPPPPTGPVGTFLQVGDLIEGRKLHEAARLANGDVIVMGGVNQSGTVLSSAEVYDYHYGTFVAVSTSMVDERERFTLTQFAGSGVLLLCGGSNSTGTLATAETCDPSTFAFTATTGSMTSPRKHHASVQLLNGNVLVCGGRDAAGTPLATCEIYDQSTDTFLACVNSMAAARADHSVTLLGNGKVLIAGGVDGAGTPLTTAEIFDTGGGAGDQGTFTATGFLPSGRAGHVARIINVGTFAGQVVLFGGYQGSAGSPVPLLTADVFDPMAAAQVGDFFSITDNMSAARFGQTVTMLTGGMKMLVVGGNGSNLPDIFDPYAATSGTITSDADFSRTIDGLGAPTAMTGISSGRSYHRATWLLNGTILLCGGEDLGTVTATAEIYNP